MQGEGPSSDLEAEPEVSAPRRGSAFLWAPQAGGLRGSAGTGAPGEAGGSGSSWHSSPHVPRDAGGCS